MLCPGNITILWFTLAHKISAQGEAIFLLFWSKNIAPRLAIAVPGQCGLGEATCYWQAMVCWLQRNLESFFWYVDFITLMVSFVSTIVLIFYESFSRHRRLITEIIKSGSGEFT